MTSPETLKEDRGIYVQLDLRPIYIALHNPREISLLPASPRSFFKYVTQCMECGQRPVNVSRIQMMNIRQLYTLNSFSVAFIEFLTFILYYQKRLKE
jgi:hypothetical protein